MYGKKKSLSWLKVIPLICNLSYLELNPVFLHSEAPQGTQLEDQLLWLIARRLQHLLFTDTTGDLLHPHQLLAMCSKKTTQFPHGSANLNTHTPTEIQEVLDRKWTLTNNVATGKHCIQPKSDPACSYWWDVRWSEEISQMVSFISRPKGLRKGTQGLEKLDQPWKGGSKNIGPSGIHALVRKVIVNRADSISHVWMYSPSK